MDSSKLPGNLECTQREPKDNYAPGYIIYDIDPILSRRIEELSNHFHLLSGSEGYNSKESKTLSLTEGLTLLNKVLKPKFVLKRTKKRC